MGQAKTDSSVPNRVTIIRTFKELSGGSIGALQLMGYLPVSTNEVTGLTPWRGALRCFYMVLNVLLCLAVYSLAFLTSLKWESSYTMSGTEMFSVKLANFTFLTLKLYFIITSHFQCDSAAGFWNLHVDEIEMLSKISKDFELSSEAISAFIKQMTREVKWLQFQVLVVVSAALLIMPAFLVTTYSSSPDFAFVCSAVALTLWWILMLYLHSSNSVYMTSFLKLYTGLVKLINMELRDLAAIGTTALNSKSKNIQAQIMLSGKMEQRIQSCVTGYHGVAKLVGRFKEHFEKSIIVELVAAITVVTSATFYLLVRGFGNLEASSLPLVLPVLLFVLQTYWFGSQTALLQAEAREVVHRLSLIPFHDSIPPSLLAQVQVLATNIANNPLVISPGQFIKVDRRLLTSVCSVLVTYLVVMIQFHRS